jgi:hypothetical protein
LGARKKPGHLASGNFNGNLRGFNGIIVDLMGYTIWIPLVIYSLANGPFTIDLPNMLETPIAM